MKPTIIDTTLRDGEQTPGVLFSLKEKIKIALLLDKAGVHAIEAGTPVNGKCEQEAIKEILKLNLNADIITWNRAVMKDIECSLETGADIIHISLPVSDLMIEDKLGKTKQWVLEKLSAISSIIQKEKVAFSIGAEDATRADKHFLLDYALLAHEAGACRLRLCDTVGIADPFSVLDLIDRLNVLDLDLEFHGHNDLGMATANALAAVKAGAEAIDTTVMGLGERAGNTPLEEIAMALRVNMGTDAGVKPEFMKILAKTVSAAARRPISRGKSVVGDDIFAHESGIHIDGMTKNPVTYEPYNPKLVGAIRKFVIGKHSGPKAVLQKIEELRCCSDSESMRWAVPKIRKIAAIQKGGISDEQILGIIAPH